MMGIELLYAVLVTYCITFIVVIIVADIWMIYDGLRSKTRHTKEKRETTRGCKRFPVFKPMPVCYYHNGVRFNCPMCD